METVEFGADIDVLKWRPVVIPSSNSKGTAVLARRKGGAAAQPLKGSFAPTLPNR